MNDNKISKITRRNIADHLTVSGIWYHGRLAEPDFLNRVFELNKLPSFDSRYKDAEGDIFQHTVNNIDWSDDWVFNERRFNLMECGDEEFLKFLSETLHPIVRNSESEINSMLEIYNENLKNDGFVIEPYGNLSGKPLFSGRIIGLDTTQKIDSISEIKDKLNSDYVSRKIDLMQKSLYSDTDVAIGTAKELLETICKNILWKKSIAYDDSWTLSRLVKETTITLDYIQDEIPVTESLEKSIKSLLSGIANIVHSMSEIRNSFGSGHGKQLDFKSLDYTYAKFFVNIIIDLVSFIQSVYDDNKETDDVEDVPF